MEQYTLTLVNYCFINHSISHVLCCYYYCVRPRTLEASKLLGGEELIPFYPMLEGGRDGDFFAEMKDYFYYAQIKQ